MTTESPENDETSSRLEQVDRAAAQKFAKRVLDDAAFVRPVPDSDFGSGSTDLPAPRKPLGRLELAELLGGSCLPPRDQTVAQALASRHSKRTFTPMRASELAALLRQVFALRGFAPADDGGVRRFRHVPSAGGRHPLVPLVLVEKVDGLEAGLWQFDADADVLYFVASSDDSALEQAWEGACSAGEFDKRPPAVIVLAARFDATLARYPRGLTLVWRDAGVALGYLHLAATSTGLESCILGTAGLMSESLLAACGIAGRLVGDVGAVALGGGH